MPRPAKPPVDLPKVSVLERRLQHPFGAPSEAIQLKEGRWALRWFSEAVRSGRIHQAQQLGWDFVQPEELRGQASDIGGQIVDGRVVRGDAHNREVLMKMPEADFHAIQDAKALKNIASLGSGKKTREDAANATAKQFGDQAADTVYRSNIEVTDERRSYDLEDEAPATQT